MNDRPHIDETLMGMTALMAQRATCNRAMVGALISLNGRPIATGYNGAPACMPHCPDTEEHRTGPSCGNVVHAEANAIAFAAQNGVSTLGSTLYVTVAPCLTCAKLLINAGIIRVIAFKPHTDTTGWDFLESVGEYGIPMELELWEPIS